MCNPYYTNECGSNLRCIIWLLGNPLHIRPPGFDEGEHLLVREEPINTPLVPIERHVLNEPHIQVLMGDYNH